MTTQYAIPLAGLSAPVRDALTRLVEAPGLEHDHATSDTYLELTTPFPSPSQLVLWQVGLSLAGFGKVDLFDVLTRLDDESRRAAFDAIATAAA